MKAKEWIRRHPRTAALALGAALAVGEFWFSQEAGGWMAALTGRSEYAMPEVRPRWFEHALSFVDWIPWVGLAVLIALRLRGRRWSRPLAYLGGVLLAYAAILILFFAGLAAESARDAENAGRGAAASTR